MEHSPACEWDDPYFSPQNTERKEEKGREKEAELIQFENHLLGESLKS